MTEIEFLCQGADVNHRDNLGLTALMVASRNGDLEAVKALVANGAHINLKDHKHFCSLHYATFHNNIEVVKYLVENGAFVYDGVYMTAILRDYKEIVYFFDSLNE